MAKAATPDLGPNEVQIENVGPVARLRFRVPQGGGLIVLTGDNGGGKSKSLEAVEAAMGGATSNLRKRDLTAAGRIDAFGATIRIGQSARRSGELLVESLGDRLSIAELVDPGIKDPAAADAKRIKALLRVAGTKADAGLFRDLFESEDQLREVAKPETLAEQDLVAMAGRLKRDLEERARAEEGAVETNRTEAAAIRETIKDVDLGAETDAAELQGKLEAALRDESQLRTRATLAEGAAKRIAEARSKLAEARERYTGPSAETAKDQYELTREYADGCRTRREEIERQLIVARETEQQAVQAAREADAAADRAVQHEAALAGWQSTIDAGASPGPSAEELEAAAKAISDAREAVKRAGVVERAQRQAAEADKLDRSAADHERLASKLRDAARGAEEKLTEAVMRLGGSIKVGADDRGNMRLVVQHPKRGETYFSELSAGERWTLALPIAIQAVGPGGVFTVPQEAWEGLAPHNRQLLIDRLVGSNVTAITAQADDGEIRAVVHGAANGEGGAE